MTVEQCPEHPFLIESLWAVSVSHEEYTTGKSRLIELMRTQMLLSELQINQWTVIRFWAKTCMDGNFNIVLSE